MFKLKGKWGPLVLISFATFIMLIDTTAMNVSITYLVKDLDTTVGEIQNIMSVYALIMASLMLLGAKIADIIGKTKAFVFGAVIYGIGTSIASLSVNTTMLLIGWSVVEGMAAALMMPTVLSLITSIYEGKDRAIAFSIYGTMVSLALCAGPILGGTISTFLSWRFVFGGELTIVIFILLFSKTFSNVKSEKKSEDKIDWTGALLTILTLSSFIMAFLLAKDYGWWFASKVFNIGGINIDIFGLSITPVLISIGIILLVILFLWLKHRIKIKKTPLFFPSIFRNRVFSSGLTITFLTQISYVGILFTMPIYLQAIDEYSGFDTGLAILPLPIAIMLISFLIPKLEEKFPSKYLICTGTLLIGVGFIILLSLFLQERALKGTDLILTYCFIGLGVGMVKLITNNVTLSSLKKEQRNEGSGMIYTAINLGSSLSTALIGSILIASILTNISAGVTESEIFSKDLQARSEITTAIQTQSKKMETHPLETVKLRDYEKTEFKRIIDDSFDNAMKLVMITSLIVVLLDLIAVLFFLPKKEKKKEKPKIE
jgi:EmrB/QacA subfamily drug resistance transporter